MEYPPHEPNPENIGMKQEPFFKRLFCRKKKEEKKKDPPAETPDTEKPKTGEETHEDL